MSTSTSSFRIRSFVGRHSRETRSQKSAQAEMWPEFGLDIANGQLDPKQVFGRIAPCFLEIGFGSGQSLLALAKAEPDKDFVGIETHKPGIGALLLGIKSQNLKNIRVFAGDAIDVLEKCIPNETLDGVQIFFPDPWPKRKHHLRRLIQSTFINLILAKLKDNGTLHLATDWEDYAKHMRQVLSIEKRFVNLFGCNQFAPRSPYRPIATKFENRAEREGRKVWELQVAKLPL